MLLEANTFDPYKKAMETRLQPMAVDIGNSSLGRSFPGYHQDASGNHHRHSHMRLEAARAIQERNELRNGRIPDSQEVLNSLRNHSLAASAFTPTVSTLPRRENNPASQQYPTVPGLSYGEIPSSPLKPSRMSGHLPHIPTASAAFGIHSSLSTMPGQMLPYGYPPLGMVHPGLGPTSYPPFMQILSAARHLIPFGYSSKKMFRCTDCRYMTDRKNNLKRHMATMHGESDKVLECCDIIFKSKASLREHVLLFHQAGYRCRHCGRNFCRKALLKRHLAVHNGRKEYCCEDCDYATSHKSNLERHRKVHDRTTPTSDLDDHEGYLPEPEELINQPTTPVKDEGDDDTTAVTAANSSFEDISDEENEEIEVSEVSPNTQRAPNDAEQSIANSNSCSGHCTNSLLRDNVHPMQKQFVRQSGAFDARQTTSQCQKLPFNRVNHDIPAKETKSKHKNINEKSELYTEKAFEYDRGCLAKNTSNVCTGCSLVCDTTHEFNRHQLFCPVQRSMTSNSSITTSNINNNSSRSPRNPDAPDAPGNLVAAAPEFSRKRKLSFSNNEREESDYNVKHHTSYSQVNKSPAFCISNNAKTTSAPVSQATGSQRYNGPGTNYSRMPVITPFGTTRPEHLNTQQSLPHYTANINFVNPLDLPKFPSTLQPYSLVQNLRDFSTVEGKQNKRCLRSIRKPSEHNAKESNGSVKEANQRKAAKHMINDMDRSQQGQQESHEHSENDDDDNDEDDTEHKILPFKKRSVTVKK